MYSPMLVDTDDEAPIILSETTNLDRIAAIPSTPRHSVHTRRHLVVTHQQLNFDEDYVPETYERFGNTKNRVNPNRLNQLSNIEDTRAEDADVATCYVCMENESCIFFLPCQHMVACAGCTKEWFSRDTDPISPTSKRKCMKCQALVERYFRVFK